MNEAVAKAVQAWETAPFHVRSLAGAYVDPLMIAMLAIVAELESLKKEVAKNGN